MALNPSGYYAAAGVLPSTASPQKGIYFFANNNGNAISVNIQTNGEIRVFNETTDWVSLDGINFFID